MNWLWNALFAPRICYISGGGKGGGGGGYVPGNALSKTADFIQDPLDIIPHTGAGNELRRAQVDPLGLFYKAPQRVPTEEELAQQEEERKAALRAKINRLYGIGGNATNPAPSAGVTAMETATTGDPELGATRKQMQDELDQVASANRNYYTDQLNRTYTKAERNTRFNLARQGLLGGSEDSNQEGEVRSDRDLGATRVDEAVRKAVAGLTTSREQERLRAIQLVNAGAGDTAIDAAAAGLRSSFANANNASKADLFGDLFANSADAAATQNVNAANAALLARYKQSLGSFFPAASTTSGRVTPTE